MSEPLVSIITPNFNSEKFLRQTAASVFMQSYPRWEWIIVDDGSTDGSPEILKELANLNPRVRIFFLESNQGPAIARNFAIEKSTGDYLAFIDSDDLWLPNKLKVQVAFMEKTNFYFSHHSYRRISEDGERTGQLIEAGLEVSAAGLLKNRGIGNLTVMLKKKPLLPLKMEKCAHEDLLFWYRILAKHKILARGIPEDLARYRVVANSRSNNKKLAAQNVWKTYRGPMRLSLFRATYYFFCYLLSSARRYHAF